ncbi:MAG: prepilin peptidase [Gemmatimonadota bacterium]
MNDDLAVMLFAGALGAIIGSFLNVCILRLPANQSVVSPPSRCPKCGSGVKWYDNIPVLSWLVLRGKCRNCQNPISVQYPLVELTTGLIWAWMASRYGFELDALRAALFLTILLGIAMTDAREYIIPDEFSLGGLTLGILLSLIHGWHGAIPALIGAAVGFTLMWLIAEGGKRAFKKEAMGGGDLKMMAMVGAFVGWQGVFLTIFMGAVVGTVAFLPIVVLHFLKNAGSKAKASTSGETETSASSEELPLVPFGVFLAIAAAIVFLWGDVLIGWYTNYVFNA